MKERRAMMGIKEIVDTINDIFIYEDELENDLTQQSIEDLITCPKCISEPEKLNKGFVIDNNQKRFKVPLFAKDFPQVKFTMDIRESIKAPENSSVILTLLEANKNVCLFRCNGPHNEPNGTLHTEHHSHTMLISDLLKNRLTKARLRQKENYKSFPGAVQYFIKKCNIIGLENILPPELGNIRQISLEDLNER